VQNSVAQVISCYFESQIVSGVRKDGTDSVLVQLIDEENEQCRILPTDPDHSSATRQSRAAWQIARPFQAGPIRPQSAVSFIRKFVDDFHPTAGGMVPQGLKLGHHRLLRLRRRAGNPRIEGGSHFSHLRSPLE
jgi:hypothetical protein